MELKNVRKSALLTTIVGHADHFQQDRREGVPEGPETQQRSQYSRFLRQHLLQAGVCFVRFWRLYEAHRRRKRCLKKRVLKSS